MNARRFAFASVLLAATLLAPQIFAHCQIPCGIYGDETRFDLMEEHVTTIEKSMNEINQIGAAGDKNYNQLVRWVDNKEHHAAELTDIVTFYFLAQRIKPTDSGDEKAYTKYQKELELLHHIMVYAMKAKQTTDLANVEKLRGLIADFKASYLGEHGHAH